MKKLFLLLILFLFAGCATFANNQKDVSLFTPEEQILIKEGRISVGMSEAALIASWGDIGNYRPAHTEKLNAAGKFVYMLFGDRYSLWKIKKYVSGGSALRQYIYRAQGMHGDRYDYVYVEHGKVTGWSN